VSEHQFCFKAYFWETKKSCVSNPRCAIMRHVCVRSRDAPNAVCFLFLRSDLLMPNSFFFFFFKWLLSTALKIIFVEISIVENTDHESFLRHQATGLFLLLLSKNECFSKSNKKNTWDYRPLIFSCFLYCCFIFCNLEKTATLYTYEKESHDLEINDHVCTFGNKNQCTG